MGAPAMQDSKRKQYETLVAQLTTERQSFIPHWKMLSENISPRRARFTVSDTNRGDRRNQKIIDSTATLAARTTRSGMMSGVTSPARPWFRLTVGTPDLMENAAVKGWLHDVSDSMANVFLKSNLYNALPVTYGDMSIFATAAVMVEEDFDNVVRFYVFPIGSYCIAADERGRVNIFTREFRMTVRNLVKRFGQKLPSGDYDWRNFSSHVQSLWKTNKEAWIDVCHVIKPNDEYDESKLHSKYKKFASCYYEKGSSSSKAVYEDLLLSERGYDYFPVLAPRWETTAEDAYGTECPGMVALGDILQLQVGEKRSMQAIDKMVNPPMVGPTSMLNSPSSILPGGTTYVDVREGQQGFKPAHEVNLRTAELETKQERVRQRISRAFFEDLFLMLSNSDRREITAREIDERHEEKLLALGPVLEQLNQDLLDPLIDITFDIMMRQGRIPKAPPELHGMPLKVEYISIMAQAQKLIGISAIERFQGFSANIIATNPEAADKVDSDQMIDVYADSLSLVPGIVRTDDQVAAIRAQRAKAQQSQQAAQSIEQGASAMKNLSQANMDGDNALTRMVQSANAGAMVEQ